jgi:hypothetical protein
MLTSFLRNNGIRTDIAPLPSNAKIGVRASTARLFEQFTLPLTKAESNSITKEIRSLILPNSKILLLGRPDAIVSGEVHEHLIRGTRKISEIELGDTIGAEFEEVRLAFFSKA